MKSIKFILLMFLSSSFLYGVQEIDLLEKDVNKLHKVMDEFSDSIKKAKEESRNNDVFYVLDKYKNNQNFTLLKKWLIIALQAKGDRNLSYFIKTSEYNINITLQKVFFNISDSDYEVIQKSINDTVDGIKSSEDVPFIVQNRYTHIVNLPVNARVLPIFVGNLTRLKKNNGDFETFEKGKKLKLLYSIKYTYDNRIHKWGYFIYNDMNDKCWVKMEYLKRI